MVLEKLGESLRETLRKIAGASHISPELIKELVRDIQRALLQSDVNVRLALELSKRIETRALDEKGSCWNDWQRACCEDSSSRIS